MAEALSRHRKGWKDTCITCWRPWPCPTAVAEVEREAEYDADRAPIPEDT